MMIVRRVPYALLVAGVVYVLLTLAYHAGVSLAHAQAIEVATPDPVATVDQVTKLWRSGAMTGAIIIGAFFTLVIARARVPWLQQGKRAAYLAAVMGVLATSADAVNRGETPTVSMLVTSLAIAVALVTTPTPKSKPADVTLGPSGAP